MSSIHRHARATPLIGAMFLCVALAAPVAAGACDMNAVDQQLARMDAPRTVAAANNVADPSAHKGADPSANASQSTQSGPLSIGTASQQQQTAANPSKN